MVVQPPRKTRLMKRLEEQYGQPIERLLRDWYLNRGWTLEEIGEELGLDHSTISRWMDRLGIPKREWVLPQASSDS